MRGGWSNEEILPFWCERAKNTLVDFARQQRRQYFPLRVAAVVTFVVPYCASQWQGWHESPPPNAQSEKYGLLRLVHAPLPGSVYIPESEQAVEK